MLRLLEGFIWLDQGLQQGLKSRDMPTVRRLESMLLLYVAAGVCRPSDLAKKIGITRQSINTALRELEAKQLVKLSPDPEDSRCKLISFDPAGAQVHNTALELITGLEQALLARMGGQQSNLQSLLNADWGEVPQL